MRVFEKLFTVRPDVLYCGNVAILGKQNIRFDCRAEELLYARVPGGADECRASPPAAAHRGQNPDILYCRTIINRYTNGTYHMKINMDSPSY